MAKKSPKPETNGVKASAELPAPTGITKIIVRDFKSLAGEHSIEVRPLTILAGANSSGKSSIMQPLLLMKQTLDASYDQGPLVLDGPNVTLMDSTPLFSRCGKPKSEKIFAGGIEIDQIDGIESFFERESGKGLNLQKTVVQMGSSSYCLNPKWDSERIRKMLLAHGYKAAEIDNFTFAIERNRCFYEIYIQIGHGSKAMFPSLFRRNDRPPFGWYVASTIHLPGLRGNPLRTYPVIATINKYAGSFDKYAASIIFHWFQAKQEQVLESLYTDLRQLGLTWKVVAKQLNETQFELQVGRLASPKRGGAHDLVSIADVGFGVSQTLPVVVALHAAQPGQLVYIEQPEIHLHPRAQLAMAQILANAAKRGVRVMIETHSDLILLGLQTLVAEGSLSADLVKLHWFARDEEGASSIDSRDVDARGTFGDWPEDFGEVQMNAQSRYLDASELWSEAR